MKCHFLFHIPLRPLIELIEYSIGLKSANVDIYTTIFTFVLYGVMCFVTLVFNKEPPLVTSVSEPKEEELTLLTPEEREELERETNSESIELNQSNLFIVCVFNVFSVCVCV
jgi:hypothetical protein